MGIVFVKGKVIGPKGEKEVEFLVDTGVWYTVLKKEIWEEIGIEPKREAEFILADGTKIKRKIGIAYIVLPYGETYTPVVLGEEEDENLLGTVTLEELGLMIDPFKREIKPLKLYLVQFIIGLELRSYLIQDPGNPSSYFSAQRNHHIFYENLWRICKKIFLFSKERFRKSFKSF